MYLTRPQALDLKNISFYTHRFPYIDNNKFCNGRHYFSKMAKCHDFLFVSLNFYYYTIVFEIIYLLKRNIFEVKFL